MRGAPCLSLTLLGLLGACGSDPVEPTPPSPYVPLEPAALARRVSLDLRGINPTVEELDAVEADPGALDGLIDAWLADPQHEEHLVDLFARQWFTLVDEFPVDATEAGLGADQEYTFLRSVGEEPLRIMAHVGARDLPWTDIVTADYTMANDTLISMWNMEYLDPADTSSAWSPARYLDGRPAGGVIMSNGLWWRYSTTLSNYNRGRAAAISRLLLCFNFSERPVAFSGITETSQEALLEATKEQEGCVVCHSSVDALAVDLFGFWWFETKDFTEMSAYHPEREVLGEDYLEMSSGYFGKPLDGVASLGSAIASDTRFTQCSARRMAESLLHRDLEQDDFNDVQDLISDWRSGDLRMSVLIRDLLARPEYQAGAVTEEADAAIAERTVTRRVLSPEQLASAVEDLTGYRWVWEGYDQLENDLYGYRVMAGGVDGDIVTVPATEPSLTSALVIQRLSQAAAAEVVASDVAAEPASRRLFSADGDDLLALGPDDEAWEAQVVHLHRRIQGEAPDDDLLAAEATLFTEVAQLSDPSTAWTSLVSLMLRDPAFWSY